MLIATSNPPGVDKRVQHKRNGKSLALVASDKSSITRAASRRYKVETVDTEHRAQGVREEEEEGRGLAQYDPM